MLLRVALLHDLFHIVVDQLSISSAENLLLLRFQNFGDCFVPIGDEFDVLLTGFLFLLFDAQTFELIDQSLLILLSERNPWRRSAT